MAFYKNKASQKLAVFAVDADGAPKTGDAANITSQISKDGGACAPTNDANPTELDATNAEGIYLFDMTQAETNADLIVVSPVSATSGVTLRPLFVFTEEEIRSADVVSNTGSVEISVVAVVDGDTITVHRGDQVTITLEGLGSVAARTKLWFSVKTDLVNDTDAEAILGLEESAGLTVLNGAVYTTTADGTITVTDAAAGDITIVLKAGATSQLKPRQNLSYDVQMLSGGQPTTLVTGTLHVTADVTRATS